MMKRFVYLLEKSFEALKGFFVTLDNVLLFVRKNDGKPEESQIMLFFNPFLFFSIILMFGLVLTTLILI
jgi:hypothetical protein